jgi:adenine-specific DNA-methyltransferase
MPSTAQLRARLLNKLKELFQLDQPDLDFGFYRIMHAKAEQVERFIDNDLLKIVEEAFADSAAEKVESALDVAKRKLVDAMGEDALQADGSVNPAFANTPAGKAYAEAAAKAKWSASLTKGRCMTTCTASLNATTTTGTSSPAATTHAKPIAAPHPLPSPTTAKK